MTPKRSSSSPINNNESWRAKRRRKPFSPSSLFLLILLLTTTTILIQTTNSIPMTYTITPSQSECLYENLTPSEHVTMSVFISTGNELRATASFQGPVAPPHAKTGTEILDYTTRYLHGERTLGGRQDYISHDEMVDFEYDEYMDDIEDDEVWFDDDYEIDDDEAKKDTEYMEKLMKSREERRERREERERKMMEREERGMGAAAGEPYQKTFQVKIGGWYRMCLKASWHQITAEIELRKSSELGPIDTKTSHSGHVMSYERRAMLDEEEFMNEHEKGGEGVKEDDLKTTREQLKKLSRLLNEIKEKQQHERHRLSIHAATNEHSHSRMVLNSLLETVLFILVTGFQVYTIRNWFKGAPILG